MPCDKFSCHNQSGYDPSSTCDTRSWLEHGSDEFHVFLIQLSQLALGTLTGWLKDKHGTKVATGVWYLLTGFLLWHLGTPGNDGLSFIGSGQKGQIIYSSTLLALGLARSLTIGTGIIEMTS
jgi:hypothetical protein